ncbi:unnamed protein product [marine sediment metagenome]|uniref:Uncharacterized protein n=1 Tax=marine sediment metagenome TaxID=412755 RepID=X1MLJ9_9ZZZZ
MALTYAEFKAQYQQGYGLATSTKIREAYREYRLHETLPTGAAPEPEEEVEEFFLHRKIIETVHTQYFTRTE